MEKILAKLIVLGAVIIVFALVYKATNLAGVVILGFASLLVQEWFKNIEIK